MEADVVEGCRAIGFTTGIPAPSMIGVVDDVLADRAFVEQRQRVGGGAVHPRRPAGDAPSVAPHYVANALAAAALARAYGVGPIAVRDGLRAFRPDRHRIAEIATVHGVRFVNDSKATNPHAAAAAIRVLRLRRLDRGWPAQGRRRRQPRRGDGLAAARRRAHRRRPRQDRPGPFPTRTGCPGRGRRPTPTLGSWIVVVTQAARLAQPGDVVLLAPAAASMDMFTNYSARGDAFEEAVRRHVEARGGEL